MDNDALEGYGRNIQAISNQLGMGPGHASSWKPHQYLALLFTERYLDLWFDDAAELCTALNAFRAGDKAFANVPDYEVGDLSTLAYQSATGSGKTLIMHANLLQYRHYISRDPRKLNAIYLLTPDAGMSAQHLKEFDAAGIPAALFRRDTPTTTPGGQPAVQIIEINNLKEESKDRQVAVSELGTPNLVLVDEGHLGAGQDSAWRDRREELARDGFTMEYSATFNQIAKAPPQKDIEDAAAAGKTLRNLLHLYSKCVILDYAYRHFYADGYGKDFAIANLQDGLSDASHRAYQIATMLAFYQQMRIYAELRHHWTDYNVERPLWVMLGHTVTTDKGKLKAEQKDPARSDILEIIRFLSWVLDARSEVEPLINDVLAGNAGLQDIEGNEWVADGCNSLPPRARRRQICMMICAAGCSTAPAGFT